jgi:hypothetical protein
VKTTDVPFLQGEAVADASKTTTTTSTATAKPANSGAKNLRPAGESSDPNVQTLLAELDGARLNDNEDSAREIIDRIAELGYHAE